MTTTFCSFTNQFLSITWYNDDGNPKTLSINCNNIVFVGDFPFKENPYSNTSLSDLTGGRTSCLALFLKEPLPINPPETLTWESPGDLDRLVAGGYDRTPPPNTYIYWFYGDTERELSKCFFFG